MGATCGKRSPKGGLLASSPSRNFFNGISSSCGLDADCERGLAAKEYADLAPGSPVGRDLVISLAAMALPDICGHGADAAARAAALGGAFAESLAQEEEDEEDDADVCGAPGDGDGEEVSCLAGADEPSPGSDGSVEDLADWHLPARYKLQQVLGKGSYGMVCTAWDHKEHRLVAVKRVVNVFHNRIHCRRILREVAILSRLRHSHIVRIYDLPEPQDLRKFEELYIVMERCDTDLKNVCEHPDGVTLPQARKLSYGVLVGTGYLHSAGCLHRDLKPANCLANRDCRVKICDFNLARTVDAPLIQPHSLRPAPARLHPADFVPAMLPLARDLTAHVATRWYRAPEVILTAGYSEAMDVWSAGCVIAELLAAVDRPRSRKPRALFPGGECYPLERDDSSPQERDQLGVIFGVMGTPNEDDLLFLPPPAQAQVRRYRCHRGWGLREWLPSKCDTAGADLLEQLLRFTPAMRASAAEAVQHAFFANVRRSPDEGRLASQPLDIGFDEEAMDAGPQTESRRQRVRHQLQAEIRKFHSWD